MADRVTEADLVIGADTVSTKCEGVCVCQGLGSVGYRSAGGRLHSGGRPCHWSGHCEHKVWVRMMCQLGHSEWVRGARAL